MTLENQVGELLGRHGLTLATAESCTGGLIAHCLTNIPGADVTTPARLNVELLAPGGDPGRLTIFTEAALKELEA